MIMQLLTIKQDKSCQPQLQVSLDAMTITRQMHRRMKILNMSIIHNINGQLMKKILKCSFFK
jgi:hypothetical protein